MVFASEAKQSPKGKVIQKIEIASEGDKILAKTVISGLFLIT